MAKIALETMPFFAFVGVQEFERQVGNDFEVNITVEADIQKAAQTDDVAHTVDYTVIYKLVKEVMSAKVELIETLVVRIGKNILEQFPEVSHCTVRINKLSPKVGGPIATTWVEEDFAR